MQTHIIWLAIGILGLTACVGSETIPGEEDVAQTFQTVTAPVQATLPLSPVLTPTTMAQPSPSPVPSPLPSPTSPVSETPTSVEAAQTPTEPPSPTGEAALFYQRSGGLAGITEAWSVYPNGQVVASDGREWQVTPEQVEQLLSHIEALGFFELKDNYVPKNSCCDRFTHQLTVRRGDRVHTVTTLDSAPDAPAEVDTILIEVHNFFAKQTN